MKPINQFLNGVTEVFAVNQHKIIISLLVILLLWLFRVMVLSVVWKQTKNVKPRYQWKKSLSASILIVGMLFISAIWLPAFEQFGAFLGLVTAGVVFALKDPLTNLAGWSFIIFRKLFVVGDRVQIGEHAGDIIDIHLFQFTLLDIGNWVDTDQSTGRIIRLPNGKVFQKLQANYNTGFEYTWNEIQVNHYL